MAISPVSMISCKNNGLNFTAKKVKQNEEVNKDYPRKSHRFTMPIAAALMAATLASSPMSNARAQSNSAVQTELKANSDVKGIEGKILETKTFRSPNGDVYNVYKMDTDSKVAGPERLVLSLKSKYQPKPKLMEVKGIADFNYAISSSDGTSDNAFGLSALQVKVIPDDNTRSYTSMAARMSNGMVSNIYHQELTDYVRKQLASPSDNTGAAIKKYKNVLRYTLSSELQNGPLKNTMANAIPKKSYGTQIGSQPISTENGKYQISYYTNKGNMDAPDVVTVSKDGGPELRVVINTYATAKLPSDDDNVKVVSYGMTILQGEGEDMHYVCDLALSQFMDHMYNMDVVDKKIFYSPKPLTYNYRLAERGEVLPIMNLPESKETQDDDKDFDDAFNEVFGQ